MKKHVSKVIWCRRNRVVSPSLSKNLSFLCCDRQVLYSKNYFWKCNSQKTGCAFFYRVLHHLKSTVETRAKFSALNFLSSLLDQQSSKWKDSYRYCSKNKSILVTHYSFQSTLLKVVIQTSLWVNSNISHTRFSRQLVSSMFHFLPRGAYAVLVATSAWLLNTRPHAYTLFAGQTWLHWRRLCPLSGGTLKDQCLMPTWVPKATATCC